MKNQRTVFFVSDSTGVTAETLGYSLLTQFNDIKFHQTTIPFVQTVEKAQKTVNTINESFKKEGVPPILFCTLVDEEIINILRQSKGFFMDLVGTFIGPLEEELGIHSTHSVGRPATEVHSKQYGTRIAAMNFALNHDDGISIDNFDRADVILVGVSRTGKTPTCLYLAMHYGIFAANYPLVPDDLERKKLPDFMYKNLGKIFGLSIDPSRLTQIRDERRPNSAYSSLKQCEWEVSEAEKIMRREDIPYMNSTTTSIEEIASTVLHKLGLKRRLY